ncbi:hypothetical protein ACSFB1_12515, partial [Glaesserella parasuis]|uniref:hypothetical protein n=1 Tax=Glaesserella parasuis TaxID=738 RepID=UPI003F2F1798
ADGAKRIDKTALGRELVTIIVQGDGDGTAELELAYAQARTIKLYISRSLKDIYLEIGTASTVIGYHIGDWTKKVICLIPKLIVALGNVAGAI